MRLLLLLPVCYLGGMEFSCMYYLFILACHIGLHKILNVSPLIYLVQEPVNLQLSH